ncbi:MAG: type II toxin-antitoxin system RelE/ParE family toxin [Verrucomicrobiaceae bacterium]|nr:type II toxin-antitoxin system RelE/ParE family toxin [Verrucomicrobiaceae bacterium]
MPRSFSRHPAIKQDLAKIRTYIARDNRDAANRVVSAVLRAISLIKISPEENPLYPIDDPSLDGILRRKVVTEFRRRFLVFYTVTDEEVRILYAHRGSMPVEKRLADEPPRN